MNYLTVMTHISSLVILNSMNKRIHGVFEGSYLLSISVIYFCFLVGFVPVVFIPIFIDDERIRIFCPHINNDFSKVPLTFTTNTTS